ncbi:hypothetical protein [Nakamurella leprariae]|uniref:Uncharacterized protein n=1 Tax=Nakamurella leprariae TaxID=2803911 RepID=A0A938YBX5_9ACTN|nr:hypothetical protein [Nakamurella leprariae]MBM9467792.1 hypothetical protein [Nakamurella leprariae]
MDRDDASAHGRPDEPMRLPSSAQQSAEHGDTTPAAAHASDDEPLPDDSLAGIAAGYPTHAVRVLTKPGPVQPESSRTPWSAEPRT